MDLKAGLTLTILLFASNVCAVKFHSYVNDKGETVFSNIPIKCTRQSSLTCLQLHPVLSDNKPKSDISVNQTSGANQTSKPAFQHRKNHSEKKPAFELDDHPSVSTQFEILDNIVEMNKLLNEYFPASPDPTEVEQVRQQQEQILDTLSVIRNLANEEELSTIDKAINILRSNLVE